MSMLYRLNVKDRPSSWRKVVKFVKRLTVKKRRRIAKKVDEEVPKIVTKGWMD